MRGRGKKTIARLQAVRGLFDVFGSMTIRQIFYQLLTTPHVSKYKALGSLLTDARKKGDIDYRYIVDRSRPIYGVTEWNNSDDFLLDAPNLFNLNYWIDEPIKPVIWTEKDTLSPIMVEIASQYHVKVCVTRGYLSYSNKMRWGGDIVLYFGDFDPSGLDMVRDNEEQGIMEKFKRIALTREQIERYNLPSVKVKKTDTRSKKYIAKHGDRCWELDALPPDVLKDLVRDTIEDIFTFDLKKKQLEEQIIRDKLRALFDE